MLMWSISKASAAATAKATARSRIRWASTSRRSGGSCLLSRRPRMGRSGERMTAAAKTGPNKAPRPTSSSPAIRLKPWAWASRSYLAWHLINTGPRILVALAETCGFALQVPKVVELSAAYPARPHHVDMIDHRRVQWKNTLHTLAKADLANGDGFAQAGILAGNHGAFKSLQAFLIAFFNLDVDA